MTDHSLALQIGLFEALTAAGVAGGRVYDRPSATAIKPYLSFGPSEQREDDADCIEATIVTQQVDVWSVASDGFLEAKTLAGAARAAIHRQDLGMAGARLVEVVVRNIRYLREADGLTSHAAIEVRALIESE